jgi:meiosis-specific protein
LKIAETSKSKKGFDTSTKITKAEIKNATSTMMRHLTILSQTLEPLPSERYLTMKLLYQPETPEAYEPPFFKSASKGISN